MSVRVFISAFVIVAFGAAMGTRMAGASVIPPQKITNELDSLRKRVMSLEGELVDGAHETAQARVSVRKIRALLKLQRKERALGAMRLRQLQSDVDEMRERKATLDEKIQEQEEQVRKSLMAIERSARIQPALTPDREKWEAPYRRVFAALVDRGVKEIAALQIDLDDANRLEQSIGDEQQQLSYMVHDLDEQRSVLELNQKLQTDAIRAHGQERLEQLAHYRKLKSAESQVEDLISNFNARVELEKQTEAERLASKAAYEQKLITDSLFARAKGSLHLPVFGGKILTHYGRVFDPQSGLYVFKKGVEIEASKDEAVHAIFGGKVAFSGELPDYGRVTIIDHGAHFYSICAHLGSLLKKAGDSVKSGEVIGQTDDSGTPVYFEIRSRNVAVNPLQWVSN